MWYDFYYICRKANIVLIRLYHECKKVFLVVFITMIVHPVVAQVSLGGPILTNKGQFISVVCYTNTAKPRLMLNGKQVGETKNYNEKPELFTRIFLINTGNCRLSGWIKIIRRLLGLPFSRLNNPMR